MQRLQLRRSASWLCRWNSTRSPNLWADCPMNSLSFSTTLMLWALRNNLTTTSYASSSMIFAYVKDIKMIRFSTGACYDSHNTRTLFFPFTHLLHSDSYLSRLWLIDSHTYSTLTHISHTYDSSFTHLLHRSHTYSTMTHLPLSVLLLYIRIDTHL